MTRQERYEQLEQQYPNAVIFLRIGDFYESFGRSAEIAAKEAELVLTRRNGIPMAGFPYHALHYAEKIRRAGYNVMVIEE